MTTCDAFLNNIQFAALAAISTRKARRALSLAAQDKPWRGARLTVRSVYGRGGNAGVQFEVLASSLPPELRIKFAQRPTADILTLEPDIQIDTSNAAARVWQQRYTIIRPAIDAYEAGERYGHILRSIAEQPNARGYDTLERWVRQYKKRKLNGLQRKVRADADKAKVLISREWDALTATAPDDARRAIVEKIVTRIRSLWAAGAPGWHKVAQLARPRLVELTRPIAPHISEAQIIAACELPRHFVRRSRQYQIVAIKAKDAKRYFDKIEPRTPRDRSQHLPMQTVAGDVHHVDVLYRRDDGSTATGKLIAWLDLATNRLFGTLVFLEKGKGVRQEHVIESFIDMVQAWGVPARLYLDNGSEYGVMGMASDIMQLGAFTGGKVSTEVTVTRARPYNAQAKVIESIFSALERGPFAMLPGYIGGQRMKKKTHNVGREPEPFPGSTEDLRRAVAVMIENYNRTPQFGHLAGKCPNERFNELVAAGWGKITVARHILESLFATVQGVRIDRGEFSVKGQRYFAPELMPYSGQRLAARVPKIGRERQIAVQNADEKFVCFAQPLDLVAFDDIAGAHQQAQHSGKLKRHIREMRRDTEPVDLLAATEAATKLLTAAVEAPIAGRIDMLVPEQLRDEAAARKKLPRTKKERLDAVDRERTQAALNALPAKKRTGTED